jgi:linoleoyl-CoA desaturase
MVGSPALQTSSRYHAHGPFYSAVRERVELHFANKSVQPNQASGMRFKTAVIMLWFVSSWALLTFWATSWWQVVPLILSLGLAIAGIGFNVQHDGGHGGYSPSPALNRAMAFALDVIGGSSYVWNWKHNVFHHSNPNLVGLDADIDIQPLCRLSPEQPRRAGHRFQHLYIWPLYAALAVKWQFIDDFKDLIRGTIGGNPFPRPRGWRLVSLLAGKLLFVSWVLIIPSRFHPFANVLLCYAACSVVVSLTLAITFQLAHAVEGAGFPALDAKGRVSSEWAAHQVSTSVNFAPGNRVLTWYLGGLNYQIEHHLFPKVCHLHLEEIAPIVQSACQEFGVPYRSHRTARAALASHARWVHHLGRPASQVMGSPQPSAAG